MSVEQVREKWFFFKYSLVKRQAVPYFREALRNQALSLDELEALNWRRTRELLAYAYEHVPYYRRKFSALGLDPRDIREPEDYARVPLLTRADLQEHFAELVSREARPGDLRLSTTGGSTGQPVKVYHERQVVRAAQGWRMLRWWGLPPDVDYATVYREVVPGWRGRLVHDLIWWPTRKLQLNATRMDEPGIRRFLEQFQRCRPRLLHGYVGAVDYLAAWILEHKVTLPPPKAIWLTSAPLTGVQASRIEHAFGAPVYDQYGCCEVYWLAAQCPCQGPLHMFHDVRRIEFLDEQDRPCPHGVPGRVVITDLENRLFPLIRYANGDRGQSLPGRCACGVTLPLMDKIRGRVSDNLFLPDGQCVSGEYLTTIFDHIPEAVRQFQVVQRADYSIRIRVVPNPDFAGLERVLLEVRNSFAAMAGHQVPVEIEILNAIEQKGGKLQFVISEVRREGKA